MTSRTTLAVMVLLSSSSLGCGGASAETAQTVGAPATPGWTMLESPTTESLRGLSVVSGAIAWASGAHGTVLRSTDAGETWTVSVVPGAETLDFRSLHAFDELRAVVIAAGAPARAFRTEDGGAHFDETYTRDVPGIFFDSLAFWDEREGLALGDPLPSTDGASRFALLVTHDGGLHWEEREGPVAEAGEAAFAASNGCVALSCSGLAWLATGGAVSHVFRSGDGGATWASASAPVTSGIASAGVFSIAFRGPTPGACGGPQAGYVVGGDYAAPTTPGSFARSTDGGVTWLAGAALRGFRSSIAIGERALIVVGTSGSEVSWDDGETWTPIGETPLNAVAISGTTAFAVGPSGALARMTMPSQP